MQGCESGWPGGDYPWLSSFRGWTSPSLGPHVDESDLRDWLQGLVHPVLYWNQMIVWNCCGVETVARAPEGGKVAIFCDSWTTG